MLSFVSEYTHVTTLHILPNPYIKLLKIYKNWKLFTHIHDHSKENKSKIQTRLLFSQRVHFIFAFIFYKKNVINIILLLNFKRTTFI